MIAQAFDDDRRHPRQTITQQERDRLNILLDTGPKACQVGGDHYQKMPIEPFDYAMANGLDALQFTVVKYVSRFRSKGGIEDLRKAQHTLDRLIAHEQKKSPKGTA